MIRPWIVPYPTIDFRIWIACALSAEFPYCPIRAVLVVKKFNESVSRVPVSTLRIGGGWSRCCDDCSVHKSVHGKRASGENLYPLLSVT